MILNPVTGYMIRADGLTAKRLYKSYKAKQIKLDRKTVKAIKMAQMKGGQPSTDNNDGEEVVKQQLPMDCIRHVFLQLLKSGSCDDKQAMRLACKDGAACVDVKSVQKDVDACLDVKALLAKLDVITNLDETHKVLNQVLNDIKKLYDDSCKSLTTSEITLKIKKRTILFLSLFVTKITLNHISDELFDFDDTLVGFSNQHDDDDDDDDRNFEKRFEEHNDQQQMLEQWKMTWLLFAFKNYLEDMRLLIKKDEPSSFLSRIAGKIKKPDYFTQVDPFDFMAVYNKLEGLSLYEKVMIGI